MVAGLVLFSPYAVSPAAAGSLGTLGAMDLAQAQSLRMPSVPNRSAVLAVRLGLQGDQTRFVLEMSARTDYHVTTSVSPTQVVIDLPAVTWQAALPGAGRGLVKAVRMTNSLTGSAQVVLETDGPVRVINADFLPARDGHPPRLVLDLAHGDLGSLMAAVAGPSAPPPPPTTRAEETPAVAVLPEASRTEAPSGGGVPVGTGGAVVPAANRIGALPPEPPPKAAPVVVVPPAPGAKPTLRDRTPLIVLDPGHGGDDPGATAVTGVYEKDITLATARVLARALEATGRYRVALTRDSDVFIPLRDRPGKARALGADLFISLHADIVVGRSVRGLSVYTLSDRATDREADMLAQRENRSDAIAGLDLADQSTQVASILIDLAQRDTRNQSRRLANLVVESVGRDIALLNSPLRSAGFAVLTAPDVPAILVEMGYLSHPTDARLLTADSHRRRFAADMVRAIDSYFGPRRPASRK
ncbi:N-acetylmuramoyl-L-alanine amidase [Nitrospirillum pindoramense]|uniref:N-acetylmuramoyl-L-alanine amidase n=1 Tax=Nitrospirillum amazonense TaxID=28077 RepID=A0A560HI24_9PROT|nr:N-acetylmuramoyl-L-alanine amidase [Nitrospirillum amazonense]TWB46113.1 N-acetylmuramoyl-L-alanine amidase [Nitrospirillum amazonense]